MNKVPQLTKSFELNGQGKPEGLGLMLFYSFPLWLLQGGKSFVLLKEDVKECRLARHLF